MGNKPEPSGVVQGTLDMLILKTLALDPCTDMASAGGLGRSAAVSFK